MLVRESGPIATLHFAGESNLPRCLVEISRIATVMVAYMKTVLIALALWSLGSLLLGLGVGRLIHLYREDGSGEANEIIKTRVR